MSSWTDTTVDFHQTLGRKLGSTEDTLSGGNTQIICQLDLDFFLAPKLHYTFFEQNNNKYTKPKS